ncbi:hypothetical protein [Almyronema epifaneia]|uniref:Primase C-terminal 1 domain-containing protein n=1 Tax=Almyronema epifaneia S1 TaxID=2991925 RepID=A0ABW6IKT3_9CYAN
MKNAEQVPRYVLEHEDLFLKLWPHRYDYIWADYPEAGEKPKWHTESRHPLSDRLIQQGSYLYGVRFGSTTNYLMLDIDRNSLYHPINDALAVNRIVDALEPLGLVEPLIVTSSYSQGLHLYFPFEEAQKTWEMALAAAVLLQSEGFKQSLGHLELYPNPRTFASGDKISLYQAHRLPLQVGSYILNRNFEPTLSTHSRFVQLWQQAQKKNAVDSKILRCAIKSSYRCEYRFTTKAKKFLNDLNAEIELGWTGPGMTNRILGRIAMRSYIFGHVIYASQPLEGETLVQDIVATAKDLPGFSDWCQHQSEIWERAKDWANAIEKSKYFHYGLGRLMNSEFSRTEGSVLQNSRREVQKQASREKIRMAITTLLNEKILPTKVGERFRTLAQRFQIGGKTLYRNKDLWHPWYLASEMSVEAPVENPPNPPNPNETSGQDGYKATCPESQTSLLEDTADNTLNNKGLPVIDLPEIPTQRCNESGQLVLVGIKAAIGATRTGVEHVRRKFQMAKAIGQRCQEVTAQAKLIQRMKTYLESGDPVLMNESLNWMQQNPEYKEAIFASSS